MTQEPGADEDGRFTDLYRQHYADVSGYVTRRCHDRDLAHQVVAETFTVAWRRLDEALRGGRPWLFRTAALSLNNAQRTERRQERVAWHSTRQAVSRRGDDHAGEAAAVESLHVRGVLDGLPVRDREVLMLAYWEDLPIAEVAAVLGCATGTAAVRLHRARGRFKRALDLGSDPPTESVTSAPSARTVDKESL